jgi:hypothetical protein
LTCVKQGLKQVGQRKVMTSAIWGIASAMVMMVGASLYLRERFLLHRPDPRWTGKKR